MYLTLATLLATLSIAAQAGSPHVLFPRRQYLETTTRNRLTRAGTDKVYELTDLYEGQSFFDGWNFFNGPDPTHGYANYLPRDDAILKRLAFVQDNGTSVIAVDDYTPLSEGSNRNSVRIQTSKAYSSGLFIADFVAVPFGCSTWPAYWTIGPTWPTTGELDVLEGVNDKQTNQYTLHSGTGSKCTLERDSNDTGSGQVFGTQCASSDGNNSGCGFVDSDTHSYGAGFNAAGGGVFAHLWDGSGIKIWHFARSEIPADITSRSPNPTNWPQPVAFWSTRACDMSPFHDHTLTLDTSLCGDWAGPAYASSACPGTCAHAVTEPSNFSNAKWKVNYIAVYN